MRTDEAAVVQEMHDNLTAEIERLRAALIEALTIAHGSGADYTWQALERLRSLQLIADGHG